MKFNFNPAAAPKRESNDLLPVGWYEAIISAAKLGPNSTNTGEVLALDWTIQQAGYVGRKTWSRHNVSHKNEVAQRIGQEELNEICEALGIAMLEDTDQLLNKPLLLKIKIEKDDSGKYDDKSLPARWKPKGANVQLVSAPGATPAAGGASKPAAAPAMPAFARQAPAAAPAQADLVQPAQDAAAPAPADTAPAPAPAAPATGAGAPPWAKKAA